MGYNRLEKLDAGVRPAEKSAEASLGVQLKTYFDTLTAGPVPDRLVKLTEALEQAFERGELRCCEGRIPPVIR